MDIGWLWGVLIEPRAGDEDARRRERVLNIILLGLIVMLLVFDGLVYYYSFQRDGDLDGNISFWTFSLLPAFFIFLYSLSRRGYFVLSSYLLVVIFFIGNSYAAYRWGIDLPTSLLGYGLLIVVASILIGTRFGFFVTGVITAYVLPLWYYQLNGLIAKDAQTITFGDGLAVVILYFLVVTVAWLSNREIEKSLIRARNSERELKEERDLLEVKVEQRTRELHDAQLEKITDLYRFAEFGQLASGLFHDLLNLMNIVSLRIEGENGASDETRNKLKQAVNVQGEIDQFRDAIRKQLSQDEILGRFSIVKIIENVIKLLSYKAKHDGIRLSFEYEKGDPIDYFGSQMKLHQVALNLISNALESFAEQGGDRRVIVRLSRNNYEIVFQVEDNGSGITQSIQDKVFEPFFTTKNEKGMGIGLAMTRRIVESELGGVINVKSSEGEGTTFAVQFPERRDFDDNRTENNHIRYRNSNRGATS